MKEDGDIGLVGKMIEADKKQKTGEPIPVQSSDMVIHRDAKTDLDSGKYALCDECPISYVDDEVSLQCGLGFSIMMGWAGYNRIVNISDECELIQIETSNKIIHPSTLIIAEGG